MIKLDVISDPVCPWCYIGKANLDRVLEANPDHPFVIEWHPFQLNPEMPLEGQDRQEYLQEKFGGADGAAQVYGDIAKAAEKAGLSIDFQAIKRTPNTVDAHRLIHWAGIEGRQTAIVSALFRAYFKEGRNIGDPSVLADIAAGAGMDHTMVLRLLQSDADIDEVVAKDNVAREAGVNGVPTFVIADQHVAVGAQPAELWQQVIDEMLGKPTSETVTS